MAAICAIRATVTGSAGAVAVGRDGVTGGGAGVIPPLSSDGGMMDSIVTLDSLERFHLDFRRHDCASLEY